MSRLETDARRHASFGEEALPHLDAVYHFALRLSGSADAADDLVQETFFRAYRSWDRYTPGTRARSWLFTICRNLFLRGRERSLRHDEIVAEGTSVDPREASRENPVIHSTRELDPEARFFHAVVDEEIFRALDELPEEYRSAVVLSDLEDLTYAEIAELMDVPVGTVKSRLYRGRRMLQRRLYEYAVSTGHIAPRAEGS
jgi:RNA polymerase sigma-70 factor, ECF subfamily